jgi:hypothetical protein
MYNEEYLSREGRTDAVTISIPMGKVGPEFYCTVSGRESQVGKIR